MGQKDKEFFCRVVLVVRTCFVGLIEWEDQISLQDYGSSARMNQCYPCKSFSLEYSRHPQTVPVGRSRIRVHPLFNMVS